MIASLVLASSLLSAPGRLPDTVVVCPAAGRIAIQPWIDYRESQGHRVTVIDTEDSPEKLRAAIRRAAGGQAKSILLVGDAPSAESARLPGVSLRVPVAHVQAKVNVKWGSEPEIASDNWFADFDDDQIPDAAIGRFPADTPEQVSKMVAKTIAYEREPGLSSWCERINFVAGVGGFGPLIDSLIETTTKKFLTEGIPPTYDTSMTYGSWRSPFCPDPRRFRATALERLNEGCLFWVYLGHGQRRELDRVHTPAGSFLIAQARDADQLRCQQGPPIAVFLACYTGAFDGAQDCLAEEWVQAKGGPIAVLSGSRVTMPYAMAVFGSALMQECFEQRRHTLGEIMLHAKRHLAERSSPTDNSASAATRKLLDSLAVAVTPDADLLHEERLEHLHLFNLLGDPLLRLPQPQAVVLTAPDQAQAGSELEFTGQSPVDGECHVELVCRRDLSKQPTRLRTQFVPSSDWLGEFSDAYRQVHDRRWSVVQSTCEKGQLRLSIPVPPEAKGPCHIRVRIQGRGELAHGSTDIFVRAAQISEVPQPPRR